ncbi:hypothetical protein BDV93DRAFT_517888 [Ceratobasidium sp. AG-I]|nr:hypothetical protein BDV93DRAFT_517888 [Ceratobasidium sp. AG-I]
MFSISSTLNKLAFTLAGIAQNILNAIMGVVQAILVLIRALLEAGKDVIKVLTQAFINLIIGLAIFLYRNLPIMLFMVVCVLMYQHFYVNRRARKRRSIWR